MLIIGARGFAKEVLEVIYRKDPNQDLAFYDDVNEDVCGKLYGQYPILKSIEEARVYFQENGNHFTIGVGGSVARKKLYEKFTAIGGKMVSRISSTAVIGSFGNEIGEGCNIMMHVTITNDVKIGKGTLVNQLTSIGHDVVIGDFCEICPSVAISGNCRFGDGVFVVSGVIIVPKLLRGNIVVI